MTYKAYIDNIRAKTGKDPEYFQKQAKEKGLVSHAELLSWLKSDCGLGHGHALEASTDHCHVEGVGGVADVECDSGIPQNVLVFLAPFSGVDEDEIPIVVDPCLSGVGGVVWHQRGDVREGFGLYELLDGIW